MYFLFALLFTLATGRAAWSANPVSYVGDFNGDGWPDVLLQPADGTGQVRIILADGAGNLTIPGQSWSADYLNLHWSADTSQVVIGDFTGNGRDDVLLQPLQSGGTGAVLLSDAKGQFHAFTQLIANPYLGLDWSAAGHTLVVGDFTGNGRQDVLLQTATPGGMNLIAEPNAQGVFNTTGQAWPDGYLGLQWSSQTVTLYTGDFTGNGQSDLLVQVNDPATNTGMPAYALLLANPNGEFTQINQSWGMSAFGADWSPATHTLSVQDVTGTGMDDIVLTAKDPGGTNYLFLGNQTGTFGKPDLSWTGTESAKAAWAAKMAASQSISVTNTARQSVQPRTASSAPLQTQTSAVSVQTPTTVGDMGGQSGVNGGAATYTIPIVVPPGRTDMQPGLSLSYSSRGGNGDVGMGWSLNGLSAITRCPATRAQDGYTQGVTYSATTDRLCLDGQHLVVIGSPSTYGQSGSVYRTELDSQVRVTLNGGNINSTSSYFEVDYQNGQKSFYGIGANTQFIASGQSVPLVWAIAQTEDLAGNNVVYNYTSDGSGEYHVSSIVYTGTSSGTTINSTGNREVDFTYSSRSDPSSVWLAGGLTRQTQLLSQITTKVAGSEVRQWALNYSASQATRRSLLNSVQECGYASGSSSLSCLPPDTFTWQDAPLSFSAPAPITLPSSISVSSGIDCTYSCTAKNQFYVSNAGDYDGDGVNERFYENSVTGTSAVFWVNDPTGTKLINFSSTFGIQFTGQQQDFLSNGYADAIGDDSSHNVNIATCTSPPACTGIGDFTLTSTGITDTNNGVLTGQFAGDGLPDILMVQNAPATWNYTFMLYPNQVNGGSTTPSFAPGIQLATYAAGAPVSFSVVGDLDGNGIPDLLLSGTAGGGPYAVGFVNNTTGSPSGTSMTIETLSSLGVNEICPGSGLPNPPAFAYCTLDDINGDGLLDVIFVSDNGNTSAPYTWHYQINEGGHFGPVVDTGVAVPQALSVPNVPNVSGAFLTGDFTNDGKGEILVPVARVSTYCLNIEVKQEGVYQPETLCGDDLYGTTAYGNYTGDDHSVYQFQILKFVEQADGTYVPTWVSNGSAPATVNLEGGMAQAGDVNGSGLTGIMMLSSNWYDDGAFNKLDTLTTNDGCGGGSTNTACASVLGTGYYTITPQGGAPDLMIGATNGLSAQASWQYDSLTDLKSLNLYNVDQQVSQPCTNGLNIAGQLTEYYCFTSSMWVVKSYGVSNDNGGTNSYAYAYKDAVYENRGRGFQGFRQINVQFMPQNDTADETTTVNVYNQAFPLSGTLKQSTVYPGTATSGTFLSQTTNTWGSADPTSCLASNSVYWPELTQSAVIKNGTAGENISNTTTNYSYDGNGNVLTENVSIGDSSGTYSTNTGNTYNPPDCTDWWANELQQKSVTLSASYANPIISNPGAITRTANFSYTPLRKIQEQQDDVGTGFEKDTTYGYDSYGNATSVTLSSPLGLPGSGTLTGEQGFASRTTQSDYSGTSGYLADSVTNATGQTTHISPDPGSGLPLSVTDPNGVVTTEQYDAFGRKISEQVTSPIALPATAIAYSSPAAVCSGTYVSATYSITTSRTGSPSVTACYDLLGHELRSVTDGFSSGQPSYLDTKYDVLGRAIFTSEPYFSGQTETGTTVQFDVLNRIVKKTDPENVVTTISFNSLTATTTTTPPDSPAFTTVATTNSLGKLLTTIDAYSHETDFRYDPQGNPLLIQDAAGHRTLATYNLIGQKTAVTDPDMGNWSYVYDVLGNLLQQSDAKNQVIEQRYDVLNRMISRAQPEGTTTWTYDSCTDGAGKLCNVTQYDGYQKTYSYDGDGRVVNLADLIQGTSYNTSTSYDANGRISTVTYPAGVTAAPPTADAGAAQAVWPNTTVTLNGSGSGDPNGLPLHYQWTQTGGPTVTLTGANTATATFTSGSPGTSYAFQLAVTDGLNTATASTSVSVLTAPGNPTGLSINPSPSTNGSYTLSWSAPSSGEVTGYDIYESLNGGAYSEAGTTGSGTTSYSFSGKGSTSANDTYSYYVAACNPSGCTNSTTASVTVTLPPGAPGTPSISPNPSTTGSYGVSWIAPGSGVVSSYTLYESLNGGSYSVVASNLTTTSYSFSGKGSASSNYTYTYYAAACNQTACTNSGTAAVTVTLPPGTPGTPSASPNPTTTGNFTVSWTAPSGTYSSYTLYGSSDQTHWSAESGVSGTSWSASGFSNGTYYFKVTYCNGGACTTSATGSESVTLPPGPPVSLSLSPNPSTNGNYTLSWGSPTSGNVTAFAIYQSVNGGAYGAVTSMGASTLSYAFSGKGNGNYGYYVNACNGTACTSSTTVSETVTLPPGVPGAPSISPSPSTNGSYTVSWSAPSSGTVTSYTLYESLNGGSYSAVASNLTTTSYSFSGKGSTGANYTYSYYVAACDQSACTNSGATSVVVAYPPGAPTSVSVSPTTSTNGSYTVSWAAPAGVVSSYQIAESVNGGGYSVVASGIGAGATSYAFSGKGSQTANNTYSYEVSACNYIAGNCGGYSASASVLVTLAPGAPSSISLPSQSNSDSSFTVSYGAAVGVSPTYHVDLGEYDGGTGQYLWIDGHCVSTSTSCTFTAGQVALGTYYARVYACNQTACGAATQAGNTITVWKLTPPGAPTLSAPSSVSSDSVPLSWSAPSTTTYYNLYKSYEKSGSFGAYTEVPNLTQTSYTDTFGALVQAAKYYVVACNSAGCGSNSNVVIVTVSLTGGGGCKTCAPTKQSQTTTPGSSTPGTSASSTTLTATSVRLTVLYTYTATGYLAQLSNATDTTQVYWTANSEDAFGQISQETYGNGVVSNIAHADPLGRITGITSGSLQNLSYAWDALGNLTSRSDNLSTGNVSESFGYDLLNRLTQAQVTNSSGVQPAITYSYDALGDITYKSDTGTYTYGGGAGPHAVTSISGPAGGSYSYDANGNMTNRNGTTITWNSDNLPVSITQSGSNASSFSYAPDKHRYYQSAVIAGVSETTVYAGAFEAVTTGGVTKYRYHLSADSREVAEVDLSNSGSTVNETVSYILSDHLGSVDVVQSVNQATGAVTITGMSFSAWGNRREPNTWLPPVSSAEAAADHAANRYGFTHQEMLDNVNLVHMNGRIYDPNLGRFLSVDPVFEFPTNTQSLNPYSYVLNNPLSYTDPTGYSCNVTDTLKECSNKIEDGKTTTIKKDVTGSHIKQTVGAAGKDSNGNLYVTPGNGATVKQAISVAAQMKAQGDPTLNGAPTTRGNNGKIDNVPEGCQTSINCQGHGNGFDTQDKDYHHYDMQHEICPKSVGNCTDEGNGTVFQSSLRNDYPGSDGKTPVQNLGIYPILWVGGHIITFVEPSLDRVINYTQPDHIFYRGFVIRSVLQDSKAVYIRTYGEGVDRPEVPWMPDAASHALNVLLAKPTWQLMDSRISIDILSRSAAGRTQLPGILYKQWTGGGQ